MYIINSPPRYLTDSIVSFRRFGPGYPGIRARILPARNRKRFVINKSGGKLRLQIAGVK